LLGVLVCLKRFRQTKAPFFTAAKNFRERRSASENDKRIRAAGETDSVRENERFSESGAIIAVANLTDCLRVCGAGKEDVYLTRVPYDGKSYMFDGLEINGKEADGQYVLRFSNVKQLPFPIYCREGRTDKHGLWGCFFKLREAYRDPRESDEMKAFLSKYVRPSKNRYWEDKLANEKVLKAERFERMIKTFQSDERRKR
jgi:hypothetical protein